jgi:hypothetical protein
LFCDTNAGGGRPTGVKRYFEAFGYPLRRENLGVLALGIFVLSIVPALLSIAPIAGGTLGICLDLGIVGYYALFLQSILHASMAGRDGIPAWPEMEHPTDLLEDFFSIVAPFIISFLPLIILRASIAGLSALQSTGFILRSAVPAGLEGSSPAMMLLSGLLLVGGWLYLPMAILVWTYYGGTSILNPIAVVRTAWSTGPTYLLLVLLVASMVTAAWAVSLIPGKFITTFGSSLLALYSLIVAMRMLGTHYLIHRERLGWEERQAPEPV